MLASSSAQSEPQPDVSIRRTLFVAAFVVFWMLGISARLVYLQISSHDRLVERAHKQQQDAIDTAPQRGALLDRRERELARTIDTTSVFVAPDEFKTEKKATEAQTLGEIGCIADRLSSVLGLKQKELAGQIIEPCKGAFGGFRINEFIDGLHVSQGAVGQPNEVWHGCAGTFAELHAPGVHDPSLCLQGLAGFPQEHRLVRQCRAGADRLRHPARPLPLFH